MPWLLRLAAWYCCLLVMCDTMTAEGDPAPPELPEAWPAAPALPPVTCASAPDLQVVAAPAPREWLRVTAVITAYQPDVDCAVDAAGRPTHRTSIRRSTDDHPYGIAADPDLLPYGTPLIVPDYLDLRFPGKAWQVDDTGGALRHDGATHGVIHIDLRYRSVRSAMKHGKSWDTVLVDVTGWSVAQLARLRRAAQAGERMQQRGVMP
jgi:3D (Asp-Asp-Asp) domain-containing protein